MFIETVIAIWVALGIVSLWLLRRAENAYKGCTTPAVEYDCHGKSRVRAYACGRPGLFYADWQPPRDPQSACDRCLINMRLGYIATMWWGGVSIFAGLILVGKTAASIPSTVHPVLVVLGSFLVYPVPLLVAGIAMFVANCGNTLEGGSRN